MPAEKTQTTNNINNWCFSNKYTYEFQKLCPHASHIIRKELTVKGCVVHGPRYANKRRVMMVDRGLTKASGVGDRELIDAAGKVNDPYDMAIMAIAAMPIIMAIKPPG